MKNCDLVEKNTNIYITTGRGQATHRNSSIQLKSKKKAAKKSSEKLLLVFSLNYFIKQQQIL